MVYAPTPAQAHGALPLASQQTFRSDKLWLMQSAKGSFNQEVP